MLPLPSSHGTRTPGGEWMSPPALRLFELPHRGTMALIEIPNRTRDRTLVWILFAEADDENGGRAAG
jgi:hypothetical protein